MSGRMIWAGGTRRSRMPISVTMLTRTPAATAEIHRPIGTKLRIIMRTPAANTKTTVKKKNDNSATLFASFSFPDDDARAFGPPDDDGAACVHVAAFRNRVDPLAIDLDRSKGPERRHRDAFFADITGEIPQREILVLWLQPGAEHHPAPPTRTPAVSPKDGRARQREDEG